MLHHRANPLRFGKVGVDRRPVLGVDLLFQASLTTKEDGFLAHFDFDRLAVRAKFLTRRRANRLHGDVQLIASKLVLLTI